MHCNQDPSGGGAGDIKDSTSNQNNGTPSGMAGGDLVDGLFGKAYYFDMVNNKILVGDNATLEPTDLTLEIVLQNTDRTNAYPPNYGKHVHKGSAGGAPFGAYTIQNSNQGLDPNDVEFQIGKTNSVAYTARTTTGLSLSTWYHIAGTYLNSSGNMIIYRNGVSDGTQTSSTSYSLLYDANGLGICNEGAGGGGFFKGYEEEIRVHATQRSEDWLKTSYNTMFSPSTFVTEGSPQSNFFGSHAVQNGIMRGVAVGVC
jgi:hypothetical protein